MCKCGRWRLHTKNIFVFLETIMSQVAIKLEEEHFTDN
jgi:hypothetical protein